MNFINLNQEQYKEVLEGIFKKNILLKVVILLFNSIQLILFYNLIYDFNILNLIVVIFLTNILFVIKHSVVCFNTFATLKSQGYELPRIEAVPVIKSVSSTLKDFIIKPSTILASPGYTLLLPSMIFIEMMYRSESIESDTRQDLYINSRGGKSKLNKTVLISLCLFIFTHIVPMIVILSTKSSPRVQDFLLIYAIILGLIVTIMQVNEPLATFQKIKDIDVIDYENKLHEKRKEQKNVKEILKEYRNKQEEVE